MRRITAQRSASLETLSARACAAYGVPALALYGVEQPPGEQARLVALGSDAAL